MNRIPIVISSDNNIFFTVAVTLVSLLSNAHKDTFYEVNCLCASDVTDENKMKLKRSLDKYSNFSLNFFDMNGKFQDLKTSKGYHVNYVSAYKMLIPSMFPQYVKILYLDTDILVRGDLSDFYNFDIGDNYVAGTPVLINYINSFDYMINLIKIETLDSYCNAGVMLMNLDKIRKDKIDDQWISMLGAFEGSVDQHIINKVCYGKTAFIPLRFNVCLSDIPYYESKEVGIFYSLKEASDALCDPVIFHWTGKAKPWKFDDVFLAQEWTQYYKNTEFYDVSMKREKCSYFKKNNNVNIIKKIKYCIGKLPILKIKRKFFEGYYVDSYYLLAFIKIFDRKVWGN